MNNLVQQLDIAFKNGAREVDIQNVIDNANAKNSHYQIRASRNYSEVNFSVEEKLK
jgi:hypothetical protein